MDATRRPTRCEGIRSWAALAPDEQLSELERKVLSQHLAHCAACSRFAADVAAATAELRGAAPARPLRHVEIPTWRRRTAYARFRAVGAAAAVAAMTLGVASRAPLPMDGRDAIEAPRVTSFANDAEREVAFILERVQENRFGAARFRPSRDGAPRHV